MDAPPDRFYGQNRPSPQGLQGSAPRELPHGGPIRAWVTAAYAGVSVRDTHSAQRSHSGVSSHDVESLMVLS